MKNFKIFVVLLWLVFGVTFVVKFDEVSQVFNNEYTEDVFEGVFTVIEVDTENEIAIVQQGTKLYNAYSQNLQVGDNIYLFVINDDIQRQYKVQSLERLYFFLLQKT